jgi:predicted helicase
MTYQWFEIYNPSKNDNKFIAINSLGNSKDFHCLSSENILDLHLTGDSQCLPLYRYENGERISNITDWGLEQFCKHYNFISKKENVKRNDQLENESFSDGIKHEYPQPHLKKNNDTNLHDSSEQYGKNEITKEDIFYYTYAVLHNPAYRKKYELNLKREFPRLPFYKDFFKWRDWGKELMDLHINYETSKPYNLKQMNSEVDKNINKIKPKLKADKEAGIIDIDELTFLTGVPKEAWEYKLGNRSALEWILDQYKEKKPTDPTIAEKFNTYKFSDYKEQVIDLLKRVCTVSVETMKIIKEMEKEGE